MIGIAGVAGWLASPAVAVPLTYNGVVDESDIFASASAAASVDVTPDGLVGIALRRCRSS